MAYLLICLLVILDHPVAVELRLIVHLLHILHRLRSLRPEIYHIRSWGQRSGFTLTTVTHPMHPIPSLMAMKWLNTLLPRRLSQNSCRMGVGHYQQAFIIEHVMFLRFICTEEYRESY